MSDGNREMLRVLGEDSMCDLRRALEASGLAEKIVECVLICKR
jgi:hypothetical protein